jgi:hypothetical protein
VTMISVGSNFAAITSLSRAANRGVSLGLIITRLPAASAPRAR